MFLGDMANANDFYVLAFDPVNHEEVFVRDQFAGSRNAPGSTDAWKVRQNERFFPYLSNETCGPVGFVLRDVVGNRRHVFEGDFEPLNSHTSRKNLSLLPRSQTRLDPLPQGHL